jgi:hypothetical protein
MATDHRMERNGHRIDYTCQNRRFRTDTAKGQPHGQHPTRGSVFAEPLAGGQAPDQYSLWLEHVVSTDAPEDECYWLMWYHDGRPTIPMSSILQRDDIANMQRLFASFIP